MSEHFGVSIWGGASTFLPISPVNFIAIILIQTLCIGFLKKFRCEFVLARDEKCGFNATRVESIENKKAEKSVRYRLFS